MWIMFYISDKLLLLFLLLLRTIIIISDIIVIIDEIPDFSPQSRLA